MSLANAETACVGLRARTGRAVAIVLAGPSDAPRAIARTELVFAGPDQPALFQPYHEVMELPWDRAVAAARLRLSPAALRNRLAAFGQTLGRPWRADEKASALAAWLALAAAHGG